MSPPIFNPDGTEVSEIVLPDGSTASQVIGPDGNAVFEAGPDIPDSVLTQDLNAWYRFEQGDARDSASGAEFSYSTWGDSTAYDGTVNGATYLSSGGVRDFESGSSSGAFNFDGTADDITIGDVSGVKPANFTVMCWFDHTSGTPIVSCEDYQAEGYFIGVLGGNLFGRANDNGNNYNLIGNATSSGYNHAALSFDGSTLRLYQDGSEVGSRSANLLYDTQPLTFGERDNSTVTDHAEIDLDDVRVYNRALTNSEITDIYNATQP